MRDRYLLVLALAVAAAVPPAASAQVNYQPTPPPTVTAEDRPWFAERQPLIFNGIVYYPAGAQVHFNRSEMVRSGYFDGVPVYTRTTLEPNSVAFVPVGGGLMQPYERRRSGELAGTTGSITPSFPIVHPATDQATTGSPAPVPQASRPVAIEATSPSTEAMPPATSMAIVVPPSNPASSRDGSVVGTTGTSSRAPRRDRLISAAKPDGLNGVFINYENRRWFNNGPAVEFDAAVFIASGRYGDLPVYTVRGNAETIYIPVTESPGGLVTPYALRRR